MTSDKRRIYRFVADGRTFYAQRCRARDMVPSWDRRGNPWLWFSWEVVDGEREYLACGVRTLREAQAPVDELCGITG